MGTAPIEVATPPPSCSESSWRRYWWHTLICKPYLRATCGHDRTPQERAHVPSKLLRPRARPGHITIACHAGRWRWAPSRTVDMQYNWPSDGALYICNPLGLAAINETHSNDLEYGAFTDKLQRVFARFDVVTRHSTHAIGRHGGHHRNTICFPDLGDTDHDCPTWSELIDMVTGHCKYEVARAGSHPGGPPLIAMTYAR